MTEPEDIIVRAARGEVYLGLAHVGFFAMNAEAARDVAMRLLEEADTAEGRLPSHAYVVGPR